MPYVAPDYASISAVCDIFKPWIEIWSGDEWGESIGALHFAASHTDYGLSDEECALLTEMLWRNMEEMHEWMDDEGYSYGLSKPEEEERAIAGACEMRDYWREGGNTRSEDSVKKANEIIDKLPGWLFGE